MSIRRRGLDTAVLLRNRLGVVGVEMWVKVYSPTVKGVEVVRRAEKRARRGRAYFMRYVFGVFSFLASFLCFWEMEGMVGFVGSGGKGRGLMEGLGNRNMTRAVWRGRWRSI